jgi:hypothetical protein
MAIRQDDNRPSRRFGLINLLLIGFGVLLLASNFLPNPATQVPRVPYSLFIDQVNGDNVKRAYITSDQIRYELIKPPAEGAPTVLATTPIFDMELPQRLEQHGVEFAAAPGPAPKLNERLAGRAALKGQLVAWDPVAKKARWTIDYATPWNGGVLATGGGLVFQGGLDGKFRAYDAAKGGAALWEVDGQYPVMSGPISYEIDGEQYIAVTAGWGTGLPLTGGGNAIPNIGSPELGRVLVYKIGGKAELEALGSIIAGIALGMLSLRTRSFYYGALIHGVVALWMDWLSAKGPLLGA